MQYEQTIRSVRPSSRLPCNVSIIDCSRVWNYHAYGITNQHQPPIWAAGCLILYKHLFATRDDVGGNIVRHGVVVVKLHRHASATLSH